MKKLILLLLIGFIGLCFMSCKSSEGLPFYGSTKHKPVKYMKKKQVKNAQQGKSMYFYKKGKLVQR